MAESTNHELVIKKIKEEHLPRIEPKFKKRLEKVGILKEGVLNVEPEHLIKPVSVIENPIPDTLREQERAEKGEYTPDHFFVNLHLAWQAAVRGGDTKAANTSLNSMRDLYNEHKDQLSELSKEKYEAIETPWVPGSLRKRQAMHFPILSIIPPWLRKIQKLRATHFPFSINPPWLRRKH